MKNTIIFCEGITDMYFIGHCLAEFFGLSFSEKYNVIKPVKDCKVGDSCRIHEIGGCSNLTNDVYLDLLRDNTAQGGQNIVIFDADFGPESTSGKQGTGNNGFLNAKRKLEDIKKNKGVEFDFYLWHDNETDGEVEDLLTALIPEDKEQVMTCINSHTQCLSCIELEGLSIPDKKNILNYYLYTLRQEQHNYRNIDAWHLSSDIVLLKKFTDFMQTYFTNGASRLDVSNIPSHQVVQ